MILSAEEFVRLRSSEDMGEYHLAAHAEAPIEVWLEVIEKYPDYKEWVAHNKKVPIEILEILADDLDDDVRFIVATKRKLTPELFLKLARDLDEGVRQRIACNPKVSIEILTILKDDHSKLVAESASKKLAERLEKERT